MRLLAKWWHRRWSARSDDGAMLVLALIVVTTIALVTGALLSRGWGNFAATVSLRNVAGQAYAADAAAKIAIDDMVAGGSSSVPSSVATYPNGVDGTPASWVYDNNTDGTGCFGKKTSDGSPLWSIDLPNVYTLSDGTRRSATVVCKPVLGTGLFGSGNGTVPIKAADTDPFARSLTTVGTGSCTAGVSGDPCSDGITLTPLGSGGNNETPIRGNIQSKTFINVTTGDLRTNGTVVCASSTGLIYTATGTGCSGSFQAVNPPTSPLSSVPAWVNPAQYASGVGSTPCHFPAGYYSSGLALSNAVNSCAVAYFDGTGSPYYFDFVDGQKYWDVATRVIGGVANGTAIPGACNSPIDNPSTLGVQFVFGGSSFLKVEDAARVEICGPADLSGKAPITVYQVQDTVPGASGNVINAGAPSTVLDAASGGQMDAFSANPTSCKSGTNLSGCLAVAGDSKVARWHTSVATHTGELDLSSFSQLANIPPGSTITQASLKVSYSASLGMGGTFSAGVSGQALKTTVAASGNPTDITAQLNAQFQANATGFTSAGPTLQLFISGTSGVTANNLDIDAANLSVTYTKPSLRAEAPQTLITQNGSNFAGQFVVQGSTYAPNGYINLTPGSCNSACAAANLALVAFRWGVFAWGVNFKSQPSQAWGYPLVSIPDLGYGLGSAVTAVDLKVYVCGTSKVSAPATCATSLPAVPALTSRVEFQDGLNATGIVHPIAGQRQVNVLSWAEQR